jgi:hypothetical protein
MDPNNGKIVETKKPLPENWVGLPEPGDEIEIVVPPANKRGRKWVVKEIVPGEPGQMVVEPRMETVSKCRK